MDLGPPDLPGPQPPPLLGGCHHNACLWGRCGVTGDDMSVGFAEQVRVTRWQPRRKSVRMRRAPAQIPAGVPGPRGCPRIQGGDVP